MNSVEHNLHDTILLTYYLGRQNYYLSKKVKARTSARPAYF